MTRNFLSVADLSPHEIGLSIDSAIRMKGGESPKPLDGMTVATLFEKPSLRTRVSFEIGIRQLGGDCVNLGATEVGLGVREPVADVARVLDRWVDIIVARVNSHDSLLEFAEYANAPIVNALSDLEHPCQAMADILTIQEHRGELRGQRVAYIGDGNNTAASLAIACASVGADFVIAAPPDYQIATPAWEEANRRASESQSRVGWVELPQQAARGADVVYTDTWVSMGQDDESEVRLEAFKEYQVNDELMSYAKPDALFMHDLPAYEGKEIAPGMIDHPRSVVFDQAENRLHAQKAILAGVVT
ncbi:MAG: ornithine carbamoyltransferase [SAR202 cluster bacterium]|nr:ornithine carbamoyltransferase [SAR202 cluster bacterium]